MEYGVLEINGRWRRTLIAQGGKGHKGAMRPQGSHKARREPQGHKEAISADQSEARKSKGNKGFQTRSRRGGNKKE